MIRFRTLRGRLTALAFIVALVTVVAATLAFNLLLRSNLDGSADNSLRSLAAAASTTVTVVDGRVKVHESPADEAVDREVWIYQGRRAVLRPPGDPELQREADAMARRSRAFVDLPSRKVRLYAAPIESGGRQVGTVVAGRSLAAYDRTTDLALIGSVALAGVLLAAMLALTWVMVGRALHPVREMTSSAADWSEHGASERFGTTPRPDELGELARTFDDLLDRVATSLRHEQRLSDELSHELRTPLARIVAQTELLGRRERAEAERRDAYATIARSADEMSRILETLMAAARADAQLHEGRTDLPATLRELDRHWAPMVAERGLALEVEPVEPDLSAGVNSDVVDRIVTPLLDNARRHALSRVVLSAAPEGAGVVLTVGDDGPGIPNDDRERIFEPGASMAQGGHPGAGLGLALARRLARAAGGDVQLALHRGPGAEFRVRLPG
jgi:signal transduction histidine kinase